MTNKTVEIIKASKGYTYGTIQGQYNRVKAYIAEMCELSLDCCTDVMMYDVMYQALCDYIDSCDKPSEILKEIRGVYNRDKLCFADVICRAFEMIAVKNSNADGSFEYINGFKAEMFDK